jgi:hypothetical protein
MLAADVARQFRVILGRIVEADAHGRDWTTLNLTRVRVRLTLVGHSLGALLLTDLLAEHALAGPKLHAREHDTRSGCAQLARWDRVILLSGPFRGSDLLGWLHRRVPMPILSIVGLAGDPALSCQHEFVPGSETGIRLTEILRACMDRTHADDSETGVAVSLATGALDVCVRPHSALPFVAAASGSRKSPGGSRSACSTAPGTTPSLHRRVCGTGFSRKSGLPADDTCSRLSHADPSELDDLRPKSLSTPEKLRRSKILSTGTCMRGTRGPRAESHGRVTNSKASALKGRLGCAVEGPSVARACGLGATGRPGRGPPGPAGRRRRRILPAPCSPRRGHWHVQI